jgi:signal transduction histidine kinase
MWFMVLGAFSLDIVRPVHFVGVTASVAFLILMNPPTLWALKHLKSKRLYELFSIGINALEVVGYTGVIYSLGGIGAAYLTPIYAALITYVGVVGPRRLPFIVAGLCAAAFSLMVLLEQIGLVPGQSVVSHADLPWKVQLTHLFVTVGLFFVVAFISSRTAHLLRRNRDRLRQKNAQLEFAVNKAHETDRLKSQFLANMSHEFRTPLNHIIGFTELLLDRRLGKLNKAQQEYLSDVHHSSQHLLVLINDVLDLSMIEAGKLSLEPKDVDIKELLRKGLDMIRPKTVERGIELRVDTDGLPETVRADERAFTQILYNLLSNAVKFTPDGGKVEIWAQTIDCHRVSGNEEAPQGGESIEDRSTWREALDAGGRHCIAVSVSDTGVGVGPEDQHRIFDRFEQVDGSASRRYEGAGLGLALTKGLVELQGGRIWVESQGEGRGSTFCFVIPIQKPLGACFHEDTVHSAC